MESFTQLSCISKHKNRFVKCITSEALLRNLFFVFLVFYWYSFTNFDPLSNLVGIDIGYAMSGTVPVNKRVVPNNQRGINQWCRVK